MPLEMHNLSPSKGSKKSRKRIGRGLASKGRYSGRGMKGQKSRSGVSGLKRLGMKRVILSTPKLRGFKSPHKKAASVDVMDLAKAFEDKTEVTPRTLRKRGVVPKAARRIKILGDGDLKFPLILKGVQVSAKAKAAIEKAGGKVE